ncbi:MAG TPA: 4-hydroxybenzoate octaprenyltransferase [Gammaproteobacteria bacterium]|nr:4-hydroxybenzoate octaprenyltransferase [Gammaproteobacteria bacterium]
MGLTVHSPRRQPRLGAYLRLMRFDRPIGIMLLLWPTLWALWIAGGGHPDGHVTLVFILGVVVMRAAGCVINDYADRGFDPHVTRTRRRPLATGEVSPREALILFVILCGLAFALVLTLNGLTILLSFVGAFLAATYPFVKRHSHLPQIYLGAAFGWAVPMVFAAQTGGVPPEAWLLFIATVLWATAYDTMYAMVDREDDLKIGVRSTAILFGEADRLIIGIIQGMFFLVMLLLGQRLGLGGGYHAGLAVAAALAVYQQYLIRHRRPEACFRAFLNNNWLGAAVFAGIVVDYVW